MKETFRLNNTIWLIMLIISIALYFLIIIGKAYINSPVLVFSIVYIIMLLAFILMYFKYKNKEKESSNNILQALKAFNNYGIEKQQKYIEKNLNGAIRQAFLEMNKSVASHYMSIEERLVDRSARISLQNEKLRQKQKEILVRNNELQSAYEALKESRQKYEKLIINLEDEYFFFSYSTNGSVLFVSPSIRKILGFSTKEYRNNHQLLFTNNPINQKAKESIAKSLEGIQQPTYLMELKDVNQQPHIFEVSEVPIINDKGDLVSVEGLAHDITERKISEELIKEKEEKYRGVFNYASDFVYLYQLNADGTAGKFIEANKYTFDSLGYKENELYQITPVDLTIHPSEFDDDVYPKQEKYERIWESREGIFITVEISEHPIRLKGKKSVIAVARDITERKRVMEEVRFMNEELINQKENLEALIDNLTQTQEQLVQSEKMAALGQLIAGVAHEINTPLGAIKASVGNMSDSLSHAVVDLPKLISNSTPEEIRLFVKYYTKSSQETQLLSSREKRQKKKELRAILEQGGIDNADIIADTFIYMQIYELTPDDIEVLKATDPQEILKSTKNFISVRKNTDNINIAAEKAAKVVFALKKYAHRDALGEKVPTDIIDGIDTVLTLYQNQIKQGIEVVRNYQEIPTVMCYQDELSQVWTNILQNSMQAMRLHGIITINVWEQSNYVYVSIKDSGPGIDPDIQNKIFDPFYTTKKQGEGSGLGLDIVKKIIDKHGGAIELQSALGEGANFIVKLPVL